VLEIEGSGFILISCFCGIFISSERNYREYYFYFLMFGLWMGIEDGSVGLVAGVKKKRGSDGACAGRRSR
jgi:hypothetical protein